MLQEMRVVVDVNDANARKCQQQSPTLSYRRGFPSLLDRSKIVVWKRMHHQH